MEENENRISGEDLPSFTLEDILREFGSAADDGRIHDDPSPDVLEDVPVRELVADLPVSEEYSDADEPDILIWTPTFKRTEEEPAPIDTEALRAHAETLVHSDDTRAFRIDSAPVEKKTRLSDDTRSFTPVEAEPQKIPEPFRVNPIPEGAEPFSAGWEPQYEQPIGEYVPPEPIIFRPRSRLGELKRKLMEGPEKRYYALSEKGLGKLQIALFVCMLIVVLAVASIVLHKLDMVRENRMRLLVFGELFAMLACALLCWERMADSIGNLFRGRFSADTLLTVSFAACIADGVYCLQEVRVPFSAAFCLGALMCLWSEYHRRSTELNQMDTLRKATRLSRVAKAGDCFDGQPGFAVSDGEPEEFMDTYQLPTGPEKALGTFALAALVLSVAVAAAAGVQSGLRAGIRTWSAATLAACPVTMLICQSRPLCALQRRLRRFGAVICGWKGVKAAAGKAVVPLGDEDLLPGGSVKINGVKFYSGRNPDTIIGYATAVMNESGSCLAPLFEHMLKSRRGQVYEIDDFKRYGDQGYGASICGEKVLVGTQEFLKDMGIPMAPGAQVSQAVYVAIGEEFAAVFALAFGKLKGVSAGLSALCGQRGLSPMLKSCNFLFSESFLRERYRIDTRRVTIPSAGEREKLARWTPDPETSVTCALTTQEGLAGPALAITGARSLRTASIVGAVIHILGGIVGLGAVLVLTLTGRVDLLTPANLLLLELVWAVPGLMVSEWTRNI